LAEPARAEADRLLARRGELLARIDALAASGGGGRKIRVHGDYHLGQVLLVQNDFVIADFEGEPARSLLERAEKQTAMKDVAGMLRSFDYAMHAALLHVGPVATEIRTQLAGVGRRWQAETRTTFLDGYDVVAQTAGLVSPRGDGRALLELMLLKKGLYELKYELDNRPDWVRIPLGGLSDILDAATRPPG
jgi:maltose alpha-D-glucosyltransferase/alpha-amylase